MPAVPALLAAALPWEIVPRITQPLALLALVVVAVLAWRLHRIRADTQRLELIPAEERADLATQLASKYGVRVDDLSPADRVAIVQRELDTRAADRRRTSWQLFAGFVFLAGLSVAGQRFAPVPAAEADVPARDSVAPRSERADSAGPDAEGELRFTAYYAWNVSDTASEGGGVWRTVWRVQPNPAPELRDVTLELQAIEWGEYDAGDGARSAIHATIAIVNLARPGAPPVRVALRPEYFRLVDDAGRSGPLLARRFPPALLEPGQSRVVHLVFDDQGWRGKELQARRIDLEVRGLLPILAATWSFRPLATAADGAGGIGRPAVLRVAQR